MRANADNETNELMWGSPGTMLVAQAMRAATGDGRWAERGSRAPTCCGHAGCPPGEWPSSVDAAPLRPDRRFVGPAHGFAGNVLALSLDGGLLDSERRVELERRAVETVRGDGLANWPPLDAEPLDHRKWGIRTQWCHGAPGMITSLAHIAPTDHAFSELLAARGELIWRAGP